jgi:hypothetical protein
MWKPPDIGFLKFDYSIWDKSVVFPTAFVSLLITKLDKVFQIKVWWSLPLGQNGDEHF